MLFLTMPLVLMAAKCGAPIASMDGFKREQFP
jgi:hypothetical protein